MIGALRALARGPARKGHVGGVPVDTTYLRELLRHVPPTTLACLDPGDGDPRLCFAWDVPGRRGELRLRQLIRVPALSRHARLIAELSEYVADEAGWGRAPTTCRECGKKIRELITEVFNRGWIPSTPAEVIAACREHLAKPYGAALLDPMQIRGPSDCE